jgi:hypothetical protein
MKTIKTYAARILPLLIVITFLMPALAHAQTPTTTCPSIRDVASLFHWGTCVISSAVIPLLFAVALVIFIYGVVQYVINADNSEKRKEGSQYMIWGIIGLFVMISVWGLVGVLSNTFTLNNTAPILPQLPQ